MNVVVVESPAKAKTINKYLGPGYTVLASFGHVRDLPSKKLGVDEKEDFAPQYQIIPGKQKVVSKLKEAAASASTIYLAPDPDQTEFPLDDTLHRPRKLGHGVFRLVALRCGAVFEQVHACPPSAPTL